MKALFILLALCASLPAHAASIYGTWVYNQGSWPDSVEVRMTVAQKQTTFVSDMLTGGVGCSVTITVPSVIDARYFSVLRSVRREGSGFIGCHAQVTAMKATYALRGNTLTLSAGGKTTVYQRAR